MDNVVVAKLALICISWLPLSALAEEAAPKFAKGDVVLYSPPAFYRNVCSGEAEIEDYHRVGQERAFLRTFLTYEYAIQPPYEDRQAGCPNMWAIESELTLKPKPAPVKKKCAKP